MSAGGLSYSGLVNYGKVTLPSVNGWGTNTNILRDPPKSITTRRRDRVGMTSSITDTIDSSSDRACEAIQLYPRGINPSVSVSYSNINNGNSGSIVSSIASTNNEAKLPYRIMNGGAFRPPIMMQENLLPLSRLPRVNFEANSNSSLPNYSMTSFNKNNQKDVKPNTMKTCIRPTAVYKVEKPISEPYEVKNVIQNSIHRNVNSGIRPMDIMKTKHIIPKKEISQMPLYVDAVTNINNNRRFNNNNSLNMLNTNEYIQENITNNVMTNVHSKNYTNIADIADLSYRPVKDDQLHINCSSQISGNTMNNYIHEDVELDRSIPHYNANTNTSQTKHVRFDHTEYQFDRNTPLTSVETASSKTNHIDLSSRDYNLRPSLTIGGFDNFGIKPTFDRSNVMLNSMESEKAIMSRKVAEQMSSRYTY
jgi:hypothetical protein